MWPCDRIWKTVSNHTFVMDDIPYSHFSVIYMLCPCAFCITTMTFILKMALVVLIICVVCCSIRQYETIQY